MANTGDTRAVPRRAGDVDVSAQDRSPGLRRGWLWLGCGLIAVGLTILGWVVWQLVGTNIVSERRQAELVEQLQDQWEEPLGTGATGAAGDGPAGTGEAYALIRIPRFGDDYVMPVVEGVGDDALSSGFGHFEETAGPGERGNFALAAHRITHGEPLRDMPSLRPGDTVIVETQDEVLTYELDTDPNDLVVDFESVWVVGATPVNPDSAGVQPADSRRLITLATCASLFHTDDRMVAFGHLVARRSR